MNLLLNCDPLYRKAGLLASMALYQPAPLFKKLDESVVEEEYARLGE